MTTTKRTYGAGSKRQKIIQYFREHPDARPADVARNFGYSPGAVFGCRQVARDTPLPAKSAPKPPEWALNLVRPPAVQQETPKEEAPADPWRAFGEWMTREQYIGYLRGLVVNKVSRPLAGHKDMLEASRAAAELAELMGE